MKQCGNVFKAAIGVEGSFGSTVFPMIAYSSANIFSGGSTYIIGIYFLSFLTEVEKLNAGQAGLVILVASFGMLFQTQSWA